MAVLTTPHSTQLESARMARLLEVARTMNTTQELGPLSTLAVVEAAALTECQAAVILRVHPENGTLQCQACSYPGLRFDPVAPLPNRNTLAGLALQTRSAQTIQDVAQRARWQTTFDLLGGLPVRSALVVPIFDEDRPIGAIEVVNKRSGQFTPQDEQVLSFLASWLGSSIGRTRLVDQLKKANKELEELDRTKNDFIAVASHELQSPLAVILGYISFLREKEEDPETTWQLDRVIKAGMRLRSLMLDMLSLKYVDAGETELNLSHFELGEFVRKTLQERVELAQSKDQEVEIVVSAERLPVVGDREMLEVVIDTLFNNALKFTPTGGKIIIRVEGREQAALFCIEDTGPGIEEQHLQRIFSRFYQVEENLRREHEGLGLGLAIAKDLVKLHDGKIWAESELGEGSRFYFSLPIARSRF